ncbi:MAG: hypothetical protein LW710_14550 [Burkholderiales bacterium]|uniref:hypothetical protein n=1 Tax=Limnobacter sp. TaxID=2003368 RepID=UPI0039200AB8|nr:hypothetical protein [Burkholderiales bacterium]
MKSIQNLLPPTDANVQSLLAQHLQRLRKQQKLSRQALEKISTVPEPTIKKFETTGQISLRQFLLLWNASTTLIAWPHWQITGTTRSPSQQP